MNYDNVLEFQQRNSLRRNEPKIRIIGTSNSGAGDVCRHELKKCLSDKESNKKTDQKDYRDKFWCSFRENFVYQRKLERCP